MQSDISWFPFNIPQEAWQVQDADEEIFLLYTQLQSSSGVVSDADTNASGLGCMDSRKGELLVRIDAQQSPRLDTATQTKRPVLPHRRASKRSKAASKKRDNGSAKQLSLEVQLFQDTTGLRSRKGDTGSVLWRASVHLARLLLSQPFPSDRPLLDTNSLSSCHVLELGSGTGLLGIVLAPLVAHYTATDLPPLLPLIRKNLEHNIFPPERSKITVDDLDWVQLHNTPAQFRHKIFPPRNMPDRYLSKNPFQEQSTTRRPASPVQPSASRTQQQLNLIIAVDCIYNPSLIAPLLDTIDYLTTLNSWGTTPQSEAEIDMLARPLPYPTVLIVVELRAAEVSREFLHAWLELPGRWEIWSVPLLGARFATWVGRRRD